MHSGSEGNGGAVTGGAFIPNDIGWPSKFHNGYLYADFVFGEMYLMKDDGRKENLSSSPPTSRMTISKFAEYNSIASMRFGPYKGKQNGALYYTSIDTGGIMRRIAYVGNSNYNPDAVIDAEPWVGQPGVKVQFSASRSSDSDNNGDLLYEWDFDDDGKTDSKDKSPSYTYSTAGVYPVKLTVYDSNGGKGTSTIQITVGDQPKPVITSHQGDATFAVGDEITLTGYATDKNGDTLPNESLEWEVRQHHGTHFHPYLVATQGNNIEVLAAPAPEDYFAAMNSYLEIRLTATDEDGLSATVSQFVQPRKVLVEFDTYPSGLEVFLDGVRIVTPATATTWEGHNLEAAAPNQDFVGKSYSWKWWSNGGVQTQIITVPPQGLEKMIATFESNSVSDSGTDTMSCSYEALFNSDAELWANGFVQNEKKTLYILQQDDGNLMVRTGTPEYPGELIWQSGISLPTSNSYYTKLQGDGHLMTQKFISDGVREIIWKTSISGESQDYYLAAFVATSCDGRGVSVFAGTPSATGNILWTSYGTEPPEKNRSNPGACTPRPLLFAGDIVKRDQVVQRPGTNAFILQESNGNIVVRKGSIDNPGGLVWQTGVNLAPADYYTMLQDDGNLITRPPSELRGTVSYIWKSTITGEIQDYFLGLNCDSVSVSVYEGTPEIPGSAIWTSPAQL
jgi:PKD repeat protein